MKPNTKIELAIDDIMRAIDSIAEEMGEKTFPLTDTGARVKRCGDALSKLDKEIKARIMDAATNNELRGSSFTARITESVRWTLDSKAIREEMGDDWCDARSKQSHVKAVRYAV